MKRSGDGTESNSGYVWHTFRCAKTDCVMGRLSDEKVRNLARTPTRRTRRPDTPPPSPMHPPWLFPVRFFVRRRPHGKPVALCLI